MLYINHSRKAIFIHIPKTAGSYVAEILVKYYGFTNYLNVLSRKCPNHDEICKTNEYPIVLTKNPTYDNSFFNKFIGILKYCQMSDYINKMCNMNPDKWNEYFKFCFIRHPYSRAISAWKHIKQIFPNTLEFNEYMRQNKYYVSNIEYGHIFMSQSVHITDINGTCGMNMIGRFEHLEEDLEMILNNIGIYRMIHNKKIINSSGDINFKIDRKVLKMMNYLFSDDFKNFRYKMVK